MLQEVDNLKNSKNPTFSPATRLDDDQRQLCAPNLIFYNIVESTVSKVDDRVNHYLNQVNVVLQSILSNDIVKPISLGRSPNDKPRPLKVLLNFAAEVMLSKTRKNCKI